MYHWKKFCPLETQKYLVFRFRHACLHSLRQDLGVKKIFISTQCQILGINDLNDNTDGALEKNLSPLKPKDTLYLGSGVLTFTSYVMILT